MKNLFTSKNSLELLASMIALGAFLGHPEWAADARFDTHAGRRAFHDEIDAHLLPWAAERELGEIVEALCAAGVPAAAVADPRSTHANPQLSARDFYEAVAHPVVGAHPTPTLPFRYRSVERWLRCAAPALGQHNREILRDLLGLDGAEITALEADAVIGDLPASR